MNIKSSLLATIALVGLLQLASCGSDDGDTSSPSGQLPISEFSVSDMDNFGNASDIYLKLSLTSTSNITSLRVLVSESVLSLEEAIATTSFQELPIDETQSASLSASLNTSGGNTISEGNNYNIYILGLFQNEDFTAAISMVQTLALENDIIVTTPTLTGDFNATEDIVIANDGTMYANGGNLSPSIIYKITSEGASSVFYDGMQQAIGITLDDGGNVYASNFLGTMITKITPSGEASDYAVSSKLSGGGGLSFDGAGNLFNTFAASPTIFKINNGEVEDHFISASLISPIGIAFDEVRNVLYVGSFNTGEIFQLSESLELTTIAEIPASIGHLAYVDDHLYATGWNEHQVFKVSLSGEVIATMGTGQNGNQDGSAENAQFSQPNGIAVTEDGRYVYVTQGNGTLRKVIMNR